MAGIGGAEDRTPSFIWLTPEQVADAAVSGAESGSRVVVPGLLNRASSIAGQHTPRTIALRLSRSIWRQAQ